MGRWLFVFGVTAGASTRALGAWRQLSRERNCRPLKTSRMGTDGLQPLLEALDVSLITAAVAVPNHPLSSSLQQCGGHGTG